MIAETLNLHERIGVLTAQLRDAQRTLAAINSTAHPSGHLVARTEWAGADINYSFETIEPEPDVGLCGGIIVIDVLINQKWVDAQDFFGSEMYDAFTSQVSRDFDFA